MVVEAARRAVRPQPPQASAVRSTLTAVCNQEVSSSNVKVVIRIRPENAREIEGGHTVVVQALDESILVFDPKEEAVPVFYRGKREMRRDVTKRRNKDLKFAFDYVFGPEENNVDVYNQTTRLILDGFLNGYNCSVFAYGATGAGKTHTMLGQPSTPGVMFLTMVDLYQRINEMQTEKTCDVAVSYLEVYNEQIRDLLSPSGTLPIREDPKAGVVIHGLSLHKPKDADELMHMLAFGNQNRTQHPTDANAESSRSHAVFQVFVRQRDRTANITTDVQVAKLSLIDLAGSERATVTTNRGSRFREGANINRSLLALGNVINALADNKTKGQHIPYRNSKLTRLLKDSLGGNCKTVMIAAVSPSAHSYDDTYNTLRYADRAKHIKAKLKQNVVSVDLHISRYVRIVDDLRQEIAELKEKLRVYEEDGSLMTRFAPVTCTIDVTKYQDELYDIFRTRLSIRRELLEYESSERDMQWKILRKQKNLTRLSVFSKDWNDYQVESEKVQVVVDMTQSRITAVHARKTAVISRLSENTECLNKVQLEMTSLGPGGAIMPEMLGANLRTHHLEVELTDYKRHVKFLKKMVRAHENESQAAEKLILSLLQTVKDQYYILKGHGHATTDVTERYEATRKLVAGAKEVVWADHDSGDLTTEDKEHPPITIVNRLLELPVLSCVRTTPEEPSRSQHRQHIAVAVTTPTVNKAGSFLPGDEQRKRITDENADEKPWSHDPSIADTVNQITTNTVTSVQALVGSRRDSLGGTPRGPDGTQHCIAVRQRRLSAAWGKDSPLIDKAGGDVNNKENVAEIECKRKYAGHTPAAKHLDLDSVSESCSKPCVPGIRRETMVLSSDQCLSDRIRPVVSSDRQTDHTSDQMNLTYVMSPAPIASHNNGSNNSNNVNCNNNNIGAYQNTQCPQSSHGVAPFQTHSSQLDAVLRTEHFKENQSDSKHTVNRSITFDQQEERKLCVPSSVSLPGVFTDSPARTPLAQVTNTIQGNTDSPLACPLQGSDEMPKQKQDRRLTFIKEHPEKFITPVNPQILFGDGGGERGKENAERVTHLTNSLHKHGLPSVSPNNKLFKHSQDKVIPHTVARGNVMPGRTLDSLRRAGLPSMQSVTSLHTSKPRYMLATKASSIRSRKLARMLSQQDLTKIHGPNIPKTVEPWRLLKNLSRSKSVPNLAEPS